MTFMYARSSNPVAIHTVTFSLAMAAPIKCYSLTDSTTVKATRTIISLMDDIVSHKHR
jgi:uncharacterized protein (UPF0276 family)